MAALKLQRRSTPKKADALAGIPAVFLMREPADTIHTLHDVPEAIDPEGIKQIVELVYQFLGES